MSGKSYTSEEEREGLGGKQNSKSYEKQAM